MSLDDNPLDRIVHWLDEQNLWENKQTLARNEYLVEAGQIHNDIHFIDEGSLYTYIWEDDAEQIIRFAYSGSLITALDSFITDQPTVLNMVALRKTTLRSISKSRFLSFIQESQARQQAWVQVHQLFHLQMFERERDLLISSPEKRYQRVLQRNPKVFQEIPHKYIASYLRMTPETLSRIKKNS